VTHTHEDRIAERDPCLCVAYGCPLLGVMTGSTSGANDWACTFHANKPATQLQDITRIINRHRWLAEAITSVRSMVPGNPNRAKLLERIWNDCNVNDRPELYWNRIETVRQWTNRLDKALDDLVAPELQPVAIPQQGLPTDTWQNAGASIPLWA
jgi:hypothetical protein